MATACAAPRHGRGQGANPVTTEPSSSPLATPLAAACSCRSTGAGCAANAATATTIAADDTDAWWHVVGLDRTIFRSTDSANVWGIVRARDGGALPRDIDVRLVQSNAVDDTQPILRQHVTATASGAFIAAMAFKDLPPERVPDRGPRRRDAGRRRLSPGPAVRKARVHAGGDPVEAGGPGWHDHLGQREGGVLRGDAGRRGRSRGRVRQVRRRGAEPRQTATDDDGLTTVPAKAPIFTEEENGDEQWSWRSLAATPQLPEEARIEGSTFVAVFRSTALVDVSADIVGTRLSATGKVNDVAFDRFKVEGAAYDGGVDPVGQPRANARVRVRVVEVLALRRKTGTDYDLITKRTEPSYEYSQRRTTVASDTVRTAADGSFQVRFTVDGGNRRTYEVIASYTDEGGRGIRAVTYADPDAPLLQGDAPFLSCPGTGPRNSCTRSATRSTSCSAADTRTRRRTATSSACRSADSGSRPSSPDRGSVPPSGRHPFRDKHIDGVRWVHGTYEVATYGYDARFDYEDRRLDVALTTDAARYEPGGKVTVTVRTTDGGKPVAASVIVRAIDEKLYAIDAAYAVDPLYDLYQQVTDGVIARAWSHDAPTGDYGEGGDTTGGGGDESGRFDFRDWLLFKVIETGSDGRASVSFDLSDDLTSWRVSATAADQSYRAGTGSIRVPVGLPFFAEATVAPEYLLVDKPILRLRGFGSALSSGDRVTFQVSSPTLGLAPTTKTAAAFKTAEVTLPALSLGDHDIRIVASSGSGASRREDILIRRIHVVESRTVQSRTTSALVGDGYTVPGSPGGLTTLTLSDAGRGRVLPLLMGSQTTSTARGDDAMAASVARRVLQTSFGHGADEHLPALDPLGLPDPGRRDRPVPVCVGGSGTHGPGGRRAGSAAGSGLADQLFRGHLGRSGNEPGPPDRGPHGPGGARAAGPVTSTRSAAAESTLEAPERAWLALAALAAGDQVLATQLERDLLKDHGERLGPWVRVSLDDLETGLATTAIVNIVAAGVGDPLAPDLDAYLSANPSKETLLSLQQVIAARYWVERTPGTPGAVSLTVDGATREIAIEPEAPAWLSFTPAQLSGLRLTTVRGSVLAVSTWDAALDPATLQAPSGLTFKRTVTPSGRLAADAVVTVEFTVTFPQDADRGCWRVTDLAPSGLVPLATNQTWYGDEDDDQFVVGPWGVVGQRVDFCVDRDFEVLNHTMRYRARVVTPGTYRWEPSVLQSSIVPEQGIVVPGFDLTIKPLT